MWLQISCDLAFDIEVPTPFVLMLRPRSGAQQWVAREQYIFKPSVPVFEFTDNYGNLCQRLIAPPGYFLVHTEADIMIADNVDSGRAAPIVAIQDLPDAILSYLLPSRYCESDRFCQMALSITENRLMGYDQVATIEDWLRHNIRYDPYNGGDAQVSAIEVNARQWGVCRDISHLGIALCRSLSIPARMVVGYLHELKPMDLHAWFEAYVGGRWYLFDATQQIKRGGYVAIGYGRDAADVAIYNQFGPAVYPSMQQVKVTQINEPDLGLANV